MDVLGGDITTKQSTGTFTVEFLKGGKLGRKGQIDFCECDLQQCCVTWKDLDSILDEFSFCSGSLAR